MFGMTQNGGLGVSKRRDSSFADPIIRRELKDACVRVGFFYSEHDLRVGNQNYLTC